MDLTAAIEAFNGGDHQKIELKPTRDGRVGAVLPRVGREVLVVGSQFNDDVKVTAEDLAYLALEARRALAPAQALLDAALEALASLDPA
ncbi:MAG: hypothetical protein ACRDSN_12050 [Pseudonocardiaceae bacterium]